MIFRNPQKLRCRDWVAEHCCMLSLLLAVPSCIYTVFGTVSSLHPTSFLMIFILVSLIFYPGLALTAVRGEMPYVRSTRATRTAYTYAHAYCARGSCDVYVQSTIKWRRSKRKSPRWTWILLSEGQILSYYTTDTSRTKIRPSHVKIIVFRPLIWAVDRLY